MTVLKERASVASFDGRIRWFEHESETCGGPMRFAVYLPPQAEVAPVPVLYWLSGLTCTDENFMVKAGAQRYAAEHGIALVAPDTSPRSTGIPGEDDDWALGSGAGFYVNATVEPWSRHYRMYDYVVSELPALLVAEPALDTSRESIFGHSMGGHGALVIALRNPGRYRSVSAFSPICSPTRCPWGQRIFAEYLGAQRDEWRQYDAACLIRDGATTTPILVDQGDGDEFREEQLKPELLEAACRASGQLLDLRMQPGYDHSYYFIASFLGEHISYHADALGGS